MIVFNYKWILSVWKFDSVVLLKWLLVIVLLYYIVFKILLIKRGDLMLVDLYFREIFVNIFILFDKMVIFI